MKIAELLFVRRLANQEQGEQKIRGIAGVAAMRLDGLGSRPTSAEAALTIWSGTGAIGGLRLFQTTASAQ